MNAPDRITGSFLIRLTPDGSTGATAAELLDDPLRALGAWSEAQGGTILSIRPLPADSGVSLGALARCDPRLWHLLDGQASIAASVQACRACEVRGIVVERIELLDDASAATVHHLVDSGAARLIATISHSAPIPERILGLVVSDSMLVIDLDEFSTLASGDSKTDAAPIWQSTLLTQREREIAEYVREGWRNREIADRLKISVRTVEGHVLRLCRKLGLADRSGLIDSPDTPDRS